MSSLRITTGPALDPVSLMEAKAHCRVDTDEDDGLLAGYILAARDHIEKETGRALLTQTLQLKLDGDWPVDSCGNDRIELPRPPSASVSSITYVDTAGATQTLAGDQYQFTLGDLYAYVRPAYGVAWPAVRDQADAITVNYIAGYGSNPGDVPASLRQAVMLMVGHLYENREAVTQGQMTETPLAVDRLLRSFLTYW